MLYYLSYGEFPSKKAHSIQMIQMCDAFVQSGVETTLLHPSYGNGGVNFDCIAEYYGVTNEFDIKTIPSFSGKNSIPNVPTSGEVLITAWLGGNLIRGKISSDDIIFSRYTVPTWGILQICRALPKHRRPLVIFEQHKELNNHPLITDNFYQLVDGVIFTANAIRRPTIKKYKLDNQKTAVYPNGVNLEAYDQISKSDARQELGISRSEDVVMYTGHLYPGKRVEDLIKAAKKLEAQVYIIGGYEEDVNRLKSNYPNIQNVTFTGFVPPNRIPKYQRATDVLVVTSDPDSEYYSQIKLFEYLAAERPIVATRTPTFEEVMEDGVHCQFVQPGNINQLQETITNLLENKKTSKDMGRNARELAEEYSWNNRAGQILEFVNYL